MELYRPRDEKRLRKNVFQSLINHYFYDSCLISSVCIFLGVLTHAYMQTYMQTLIKYNMKYTIYFTLLHFSIAYFQMSVFG